MADDRNVLQLVKSGKTDELGDALAALRKAAPGMIEYNRIMAKVQREAYIAYITEGFTPAQALELCKAVRG